jgi:diaminopimelate decarboxylase
MKTRKARERVDHPSRFCLGGVARPPAFAYRDCELHCERAALSALAKKFGTPLYLYSQNTIRERYRTFDEAFRGVPHTICYSVKANSNLSLLKMLAGMGCGFDVVSGGELLRVLKASRGAAKKVVFSGVGKTADELDLALKSEILMFNVESEQELALLGARATELKREARIALRVNPDVAARTHPYISTGLHKHKFGVPMQEARAIYAAASYHPWLDVAGISVHIGSQITDVKPFGEAMARVADLVRDLLGDGHHVRYVDAGGGLGIDYERGDLSEFPKQAGKYAKLLTNALRGLDVYLLLEPGRSIVGPAGALVTRVLYNKRNNGKRFVVVDAAMNDLIRPALYGAYHEIVPVLAPEARSSKPEACDVVGPICETGDFFARDRELPCVSDGDLLAILDAGAYGMSISSNYNTRGRAAEVLVDGKKAKLIRKRETFDDLTRNET